MAQIVFNSYNCISCSQAEWNDLYFSAVQNIKNILYDLEFSSSDLGGLYQQFRTSAQGLNYNAEAFNDFYSNITQNIDRLKNSSISLNDTLKPMDIYVQNAINELTIETYAKCINAISSSINQNFSCVYDINIAQTGIFTEFQSGMQFCFTFPVVLEIRSNLFKALQIAMKNFNHMKQCLYAIRLTKKTKPMLQTPVEICLDNVSFLVINSQSFDLRFLRV